jgi:hypothetical protein
VVGLAIAGVAVGLQGFVGLLGAVALAGVALLAPLPLAAGFGHVVLAAAFPDALPLGVDPSTLHLFVAEGGLLLALLADGPPLGTWFGRRAVVAGSFLLIVLVAGYAYGRSTGTVHPCLAIGLATIGAGVLYLTHRYEVVVLDATN